MTSYKDKIILNVKPELKRKLKGYAGFQGKSLNKFVNEILIKYSKKHYESLKELDKKAEKIGQKFKEKMKNRLENQNLSTRENFTIENELDKLKKSNNEKE